MSEQEISRRTRRSFLTGAIASACGLGAWGWLASRRPDDGVPWPLRIALRANEQLWRDLSNSARLARTFATEDIETARENGDVGLDEPPAPDWKLTVDGIPDADEPLTVSLGEIQKLPKTEMITEFKCIEGWSYIHKFGGARFLDFAAKFAPGIKPNSYVALETPGRDYYVGLDIESAMHPQTLLCYEMNGKPLEASHGAPLRLVIPLKYGVKNLKRIGKIAFSEARPPDYWAERGYDYYAGF